MNQILLWCVGGCCAYVVIFVLAFYLRSRRKRKNSAQNDIASSIENGEITQVVPGSGIRINPAEFYIDHRELQRRSFAYGNLKIDDGNITREFIDRIAEFTRPYEKIELAEANDIVRSSSATRPSWPHVWMNVARSIAERSYDARLKVGCVIVPDDNTSILSLGYNGNAQGLPNEPESEEPGQSGFLHSELNACLKLDFSFHKKKIMYVTHSPCRNCAKIIINARISKVVYGIPYRDVSPIELLRNAGVEVVSLAEELNEGSAI